MSSRTPEECVDLALDEGAAEEKRVGAIRELRTANECDELEALVRTERIDDRYRRQALEELATPQCDSTLRELVDDEPLEGPLHREAEELLATVEDD
ncbi:hypothetical protein HYG81_17950 [Natrinema zhouii]|uniref:HEAT repeat domain-containing protein n=1 Tax=Natrinema zhouii TaxID=1710539 RepID=A0A7D6CPQ1_9EURY|nr:hypothetical protein [Natrinema zhouii]QLK25934.1 hypothetical protein HYG81_17950 [Natrinema zhouii]